MTGVTSSILRGTLIALAAISWAVPQNGSAQSLFGPTQKSQTRREEIAPTLGAQQVPVPVTFRELRGRGLLVSAWLNGRGPYTFAIDTGAGATVVSERLVFEARLSVRSGRRTVLGGLSGFGRISDRETTIHQLALGEPGNILPSESQAVLAPSLPAGLDGILDPTEAYYPLGYSIDFPRRSIEAFDPHLNPLNASQQPPGGAVVKWAREAGSKRPFVRLGDGRLALLDTGSGFGFAVSESGRSPVAKTRAGAQDLSGASIRSRRVAPTVITIGSMVLRGVPTDLLSGTEKGAPTLLGREALYPFRITFDPLKRLIEIAPMLED
jgi:aspartyl protease